MSGLREPRHDGVLAAATAGGPPKRPARRAARRPWTARSTRGAASWRRGSARRSRRASDLLRTTGRGRELVVADVGANKGFFSGRARRLRAGLRRRPEPREKRRVRVPQIPGPAERPRGRATRAMTGTPPATARRGLDTVVPPSNRARRSTAWRRPSSGRSSRDGAGVALARRRAVGLRASLLFLPLERGLTSRQRVRGSGRRLTGATSVVVNVTTPTPGPARHGVERIGLLKIDAEGHDFRLLTARVGYSARPDRAAKAREGCRGGPTPSAGARGPEA